MYTKQFFSCLTTLIKVRYWLTVEEEVGVAKIGLFEKQTKKYDSQVCGIKPLKMTN